MLKAKFSNFSYKSYGYGYQWDSFQHFGSLGRTATFKTLTPNFRYIICDDPWEKGIFEDVDVKFQAHLCLKFDVDVSENAFFINE